MIPEVYWSMVSTEQRRTEFGDALDQELLKERASAFIKLEGPQVGDWCIFPDGEYRRLTHNWADDTIQTTCSRMYGSYHLCKDGGVSYSGSLDPAIPKAKLELMDELKAAPFWFFHHDHATGGNGVNVNVLARVWRYRP